ncbi:MAG: PKD domain-containing protein, partial [Thermoplasmata archaeon]|nr:PKD domain-containing protein [Thermoplasmata archaeon]
AYYDVPYIWLYQAKSFQAMRSTLNGYYYNPMYGGFYYAALDEVPPNLPPAVSFTVLPTTGDISTTFTFNASGSYDPDGPNESLQFRWDWNDDSSWDTSWSSNPATSHQYLQIGNYTVRLEVMDEGLSTNSTTRMVLVNNTPPTASFTFFPGIGDITMNFSFNATSSSDLEDGTGLLQVRWDWEGDGTWDTNWSYNKSASHLFTVPGNYSVKLEVMDSGNMTNVTSMKVEVWEIIPEFGLTIIPVLSIMFIALAFRTRLKKNNDRRRHEK